MDEEIKNVVARRFTKTVNVLMSTLRIFGNPYGATSFDLFAERIDQFRYNLNSK